MTLLELQKAIADGLMFFYHGINILYVFCIIPVIAYFGVKLLYYGSQKKDVADKSFRLLDDLHFLMLSTSASTEEDSKFFLAASEAIAKTYGNTKMCKKGLDKAKEVNHLIREYIANFEKRFEKPEC